MLFKISFCAAISKFINQNKKNIILHTGDWKFNGAKNLKEKPFINELKMLKNLKISTIVSDSTNSLISGYTPSENHAHNGLKKIIAKSKGLIIITCFSSNISRIKSILEIAKTNEKKVCILGRAIKRSVEAAIDVGLIEKSCTFYSLMKLKSFPRNF